MEEDKTEIRAVLRGSPSTPTFVGNFFISSPYHNHEFRGIIFMSTTVRKTQQRLLAMVLVAMFCALAYVVECIFHIRVTFLTFDLKDFVITVGGMILGPLPALIMSAVVSVLEFLTISGTGIWGLIMNFAGTASFSVTAALIYRYRKSLFGAIIALITAVAAMTAVMLIANLIITPIYTGATRGAVAGMIPTLLLPFNLAKAILNAAVVLAFYKPIVTALRNAKLVSGSAESYKFDRSTLIMLGIAILLMTVSIVILVNLNATASWFDVIKGWFSKS